VIQINFANLNDFIDEHKKYGYPDLSLVRAQVIEDPHRLGGYQVVVTSHRGGQIFRYNAHVEVHDDAETEKAACLELRTEIAETLTRERFKVREGIVGVADS
jgi:hypothetical protein